MAVQPATDQPQATEANRRVWVENTWDKDYKETWRGKEIVVPANGRIEMGFLEARRFLAQGGGDYELLPNGQYRGVPKALKVVEKDKQEAAPAPTELFTCMKCGDSMATEKGLKLHVTRMHPDAA